MVGAFAELFSDLCGSVWLQQIAGGIYPPGIQSKLTEGRYEDHTDPGIVLFQFSRKLETVEFRHLHIQKCHIHRVFLGKIQCFFTALKSVQCSDLRKVCRRQTKIVDGGFFIVYIDDAHASASFLGIVIVTMVPFPISLSISSVPFTR